MSLSDIIVQAFEDRLQFSPTNAPQDVRDAVAEAIQLLDSGKARVAEKVNGEWVVNQWLKKAVLLSFRLNDNEPLSGGSAIQFYDKVPTKFADWTAEQFKESGIRVVPPATARRGVLLHVTWC